MKTNKNGFLRRIWVKIGWAPSFDVLLLCVVLNLNVILTLWYHYRRRLNCCDISAAFTSETSDVSTSSDLTSTCCTQSPSLLLCPPPSASASASLEALSSTPCAFDECYYVAHSPFHFHDFCHVNKWISASLASRALSLDAVLLLCQTRFQGDPVVSLFLKIMPENCRHAWVEG